MPIERKTLVLDGQLQQNSLQTLQLRRTKKNSSDCIDRMIEPLFVICSARL
jgi:hypothetical protein